MTKTLNRPNQQSDGVPFSNDGHQRSGTSASKVIGLTLLGVLVAVVALFVAAVFAVTLLGFGISSSGDLEPQDLPPVAGAPEADIVMVVTPFGTSGDDVDRQFNEIGGSSIGPDVAVQTGSVVRLFDVRTSFEDYSFFRWSQMLEETGPQLSADSCFGAFASNGSFSSCSDSADVKAPVPSISSGSTSDETQTAFDLTVSGLSEEAAWAVVDTDSGLTVAAQVVDGMTYLQWPGTNVSHAGAASATALRVLDADFNQISIQEIG